jgi:hypothetical protein
MRLANARELSKEAAIALIVKLRRTDFGMTRRAVMKVPVAERFIASTALSYHNTSWCSFQRHAKTRMYPERKETDVVSVGT